MGNWLSGTGWFGNWLKRLFRKPKPDKNKDGDGDKPFSIDGSDVIEPDKKDKKELKVENVNFSGSDNAKRHHTEEYDDETVKRIVFRRGEHFDMNITFSRPFDKKNDDIRLVFAFGKAKKGHVELTLTDKTDVKKWSANVLNQDSNSISVRISTPPTLYIGKWKFSLDVMKKVEEKNVAVRYNHPEPIYILFNPWCKDDQVYLPDDDLLQEYIQNETGNIYKAGFMSWPVAQPWNFGQFDPPVLECTTYLLDEKSGLSLTERSDPIMVVRRLSALANVQDESGILCGRWDGKYDDGKPPTHWSGSHEIIQQYYGTRSPVKYGQCWVYSGVLTTLCRTIGIPTRSVTNYSSAHDTDGSMTIDSYFNKDLKEIKWKKDDSVWNFHVWNDAWLARPDLPEGYGGWQAIDATPQELSKGVYCCGPMSLTAIRRGKVTLPYDGKFIFAEVNADKVSWVEDEDGSFKKLKITSKKGVGRTISTNKPKCKIIEDIESWDEEREDVTDQYKYKEGTDLERMSVITANASGSVADHNIYAIKDECQDVDFAFEVAEEKFTYGEPFEIKIKITNNSETERKMHGMIHTSTTFYTGVNYSKVKKETFDDITLEPSKSTVLSLCVTFEEYKEKLTDHCCFHHYCMFKVKETRQIFMDEINVALAKPRLMLKAPTTSKVGNQFKVEVTFKNPLPISLTNCVLTVEGPGISKARMVPQRDIKAHADFTTEIIMTPAKKGPRKIIANFNSKQLEGVVGSCDIVVEQ